MSLVPQAFSADHFSSRGSAARRPLQTIHAEMTSRLGRQEHSCMECNDRCRDFRFAKAGLRGVVASVQPCRRAHCYGLEDAQRASGIGGAKETAVLFGHMAEVWSANYNSNGMRIVAASSDKTARIWDTATGREIAALRGHEGPVLSAAFNLDGSRIVTASEDQTARVWDAATGREIASNSGARGSSCLLPSATTGRASSRRHQTRLRVPGMSAPQHCQPTNSRRGLHASIARTNHAQP